MSAGVHELKPGDVVMWDTDKGGITSWKLVDVTEKGDVVIKRGVVLSGEMVVRP